MSDAKDAFGFGRFVPGFDFLQQLARQNAAGMPQMPSMPGMPNWIAPTFDVEEIEKRIEELKAVQFWLDQNATALKATLQALEVQKMTLAALRGMNVSMDDVASAFTARPAANPYADVGKPITPQPAPAAAAPPPAAGAPAEAPAAQEPPATDGAAADDAAAARPRKKAAAPAGARPDAPGLVDPMQWWGALTDQFQQIAGSAMKDAQRAGAAGPFAHAFAQPAGARAAATGEAGAKKAGAKTSGAKAAAKAGSAAARKPAAKTAAKRKPPARGSSR